MEILFSRKEHISVEGDNRCGNQSQSKKGGAPKGHLGIIATILEKINKMYEYLTKIIKMKRMRTNNISIKIERYDITTHPKVTKKGNW